MKISLRSKHGGRLQALDENGRVLDDVLGIEMLARAPDFIPQITIHLRGPIVVTDAAAEIFVAPPEIIVETPTGLGRIDEKTSQDKPE